jgi:hypothetical protein
MSMRLTVTARMLAQDVHATYSKNAGARCPCDLLLQQECWRKMSMRLTARMLAQDVHATYCYSKDAGARCPCDLQQECWRKMSMRLTVTARTLAQDVHATYSKHAGARCPFLTCIHELRCSNPGGCLSVLLSDAVNC